MSFTKSEYPDNWKEIRARILKRANNHCERCGVKNYAIASVDFEEQLIGLVGVCEGADEDHINWVRCENCEFIPYK